MKDDGLIALFIGEIALLRVPEVCSNVIRYVACLDVDYLLHGPVRNMVDANQRVVDSITSHNLI